MDEATAHYILSAYVGALSIVNLGMIKVGFSNLNPPRNFFGRRVSRARFKEGSRLFSGVFNGLYHAREKGQYEQVEVYAPKLEEFLENLALDFEEKGIE